jgi:aminopeptidase N
MRTKKLFYLFFLILLLTEYSGISQNQTSFSRQDSLRGTLNSFRSCYDVTFYDLFLQVNPENKTLSGSNTIYFTIIKASETLQFDLFENLIIDSVSQAGKRIDFKREGNAFFVYPEYKSVSNGKSQVKISYHGKPTEAVKPPWDGGFVWRQDSLGNPWVGTACEGMGASSWWPLKDHLSDEPDSMHMTFEVPTGLFCVSNGILRDTQRLRNGYTRFRWKVTHPINSYNVTFNLGKYTLIRDTFLNETGIHKMNYYVLNNPINESKIHFKEEVFKMLKAFEHYFGPYPFWSDEYTLVETSYWGMEHQNAIAYGNHLKQNIWKFDYIIVHESGHEWWGNSISVGDHAEMWVHESFTTYAEALYMEYYYGFKKACSYLNTQKMLIANKSPILGPLGVNFQDWKDSDKYYKGAWMLHSLRNMVDNDTVWLNTLRTICDTFKEKIVTSEDIIEYFCIKTNTNLNPVFSHYLTKTQLPCLEYSIKKDNKNITLSYRWKETEKDFNMPFGLSYGNQNYRFQPTQKWQKMVLPIDTDSEIEFRKDLFLVKVKDKNG